MQLFSYFVGKVDGGWEVRVSGRIVLVWISIFGCKFLDLEGVVTVRKGLGLGIQGSYLSVL